MGLCLSIVVADCCNYWLLRISVDLRNRNAVCELVAVMKKIGKELCYVFFWQSVFQTGDVCFLKRDQGIQLFAIK